MFIGYKTRTEWGCASDFISDLGTFANKCEQFALDNGDEHHPNHFFQINAFQAFKCACIFGEKDKDFADNCIDYLDFKLPISVFPHHPPPTTRRTPSTTTTTTTTTTMPSHFCKRKIFSSFQNETFADECPPGENACFLLNCTSGTMPTKFVSVWGCMNYSTEACGINADKYGFSFANNDDCYCALGHSNYNITSLLKKLELPEGKPSAAFTRCPSNKAVVMVVLMAVNLIIDFHIDA
ncbi:hypothetical protein niasHT_024726 [Heterodera trifolii]|uniref:Uncharacterized protein n=1 Tax=Heterodera trifolii TaxID=157864 RepID=A0ABD2K0N4_9BILA